MAHAELAQDRWKGLADLFTMEQHRLLATCVGIVIARNCVVTRANNHTFEPIGLFQFKTGNFFQSLVTMSGVFGKSLITSKADEKCTTKTKKHDLGS